MTYPLSHVKVFCVSWLNESVVLKRCEGKSALKPIKQMLIFFKRRPGSSDSCIVFLRMKTTPYPFSPDNGQVAYVRD